MGFLDFILNVAGLLLLANWRLRHFDPLKRRLPATLAGALRPTSGRRWPAGGPLAGLVLLLLLRGGLYWVVGPPADWTPKLDLGVVVLAFPGEALLSTVVFSLLSFWRACLIFYFWLLALSVLNRRAAAGQPAQRLIRMQLGGADAWPAAARLLAPFALAALCWAAMQPLLAWLGVVGPSPGAAGLARQAAVVAGGLVFTLKYLFGAFLFLHLVTSYVYLGGSSFWDYVTITSGRLLAPLRWLPLRVARLDFTPVLGVGLVFFLLHWLPRTLWAISPSLRMALWPV